MAVAAGVAGGAVVGEVVAGEPAVVVCGMAAGVAVAEELLAVVAVGAADGELTCWWTTRVSVVRL